MARTSRTPKIRLGELLVAAGLVSEEKVRMGLEEQRRNNLFLGEALVKLGFVSEEAIAQAIIQHFNLPFLSASQFTVPPEVFNLFPERMYHEYQFVAVDKIERVIIIVAAGPINQDMMEELERVSECKICHYVSTWRDIFAAIQRNSKELGGEAQIELTGLGSLLLDNPAASKTTSASASSTQKSITASQKVKKLEQSTESSSPGFPRPILMPKASGGPPTKTMAAANLSAILSPLGGSPKSNGLPPAPASTPPSPRLTAFLKVPPPGQSSNGLPAIRQVSSANLQAVPFGTTASPNVSAMMSAPNVNRMNGSQTGMPGVVANVPKEAKETPETPASKMTSFLKMRKT